MNPSPAFVGHAAIPLCRSRLTYTQRWVYGRSNVARACATSAPLDKLQKAARKELSRSGLEITSLEWKPRLLTVFVKRENGKGMTADECADASTTMGEVIEEGNYLGDAAYTLEVSTPGAAEVLSEIGELEAFRGFPVRVKTREAVNGKEEFWGTLGECGEKMVRIAVKGRVVKFEREVVEEIRLCTANELQ